MGAVVLLVGAAAIYGIYGFAESEHLRDLRHQQARMNIIANSRVDAVNRWIESQYAHLANLAANNALQFYVTRLVDERAANAQRDPSLAAERTYLQNLLIVSAERAGFTGSETGPDIDSNVERLGVAGLAIVDNQGNPLIATRQMPPLKGHLKEALGKLEPTDRGLIDIYINHAGTPAMGFQVPLFAVHGQDNASDQIGTLLGIKELNRELFPLLRQPGDANVTAETMLVRRDGAAITYLSPLADDKSALSVTMAADTPNLAAAFALEAIGGFRIAEDYSNERVLVASRKVAGAPWVLAYKVYYKEAMSASETRYSAIMISGILIVCLVLAASIAAWRWVTSTQSERLLARFKETSQRFESMATFLRALADNQLTQIFAVSEEGRLTFANKTFADAVEMDMKEILNKNIIDVIGPVKAKAFQPVNAQVMAAFAPETRVYTFETAGRQQSLRISHIPLDGAQDHEPAVLMVSDDITDLVEERERRESSMSELIQLLMIIVNQKDPYSTLHSAATNRLALGIADVLEVGEDEKARHRPRLQHDQYRQGLRTAGGVDEDDPVDRRQPPFDPRGIGQISQAAEADVLRHGGRPHPRADTGEMGRLGPAQWPRRRRNLAPCPHHQRRQHLRRDVERPRLPVRHGHPRGDTGNGRARRKKFRPPGGHGAQSLS